MKNILSDCSKDVHIKLKVIFLAYQKIFLNVEQVSETYLAVAKQMLLWQRLLL